MCPVCGAPNLGSIDQTAIGLKRTCQPTPRHRRRGSHIGAAEQVLAAACDFSERRPKLWPNVKAKHLVVHGEGDEFADVTEVIWITGVRISGSPRGALRLSGSLADSSDPLASDVARATGVRLLLRVLRRAGGCGAGQRETGRCEHDEEPSS